MIAKNDTVWTVLLGMITILLFQGCDTSASSGNKHNGTAVHIQLKAVSGLHYDVVRFKVSPGAHVKVTLLNTDDMDHNLVFTKPNARKDVVQLALQLGANGPEVNYIPQSPNVLWHISTLKPGDSQTVAFTAPKKKGVYPYVCTYPGHGATMYGVMYVTDKQLPPLKDDPNVPKKNGQNNMAKMEKPSLHPYKIEPPYLMRTFMPDCSPAAIAVLLPDSLSYCWDAGSCRLRYVWSGKFLNDDDLWQRKGNEVAHIAGSIFFKDKTKYPFRVGDKNKIPEVSFKGYRFINHYPEFHYQWDGVNVYELIKPKADGSGIIRTFKIPDLSKSIWFLKIDSGNATVGASAGIWHKDMLQLKPAEARDFSITITRK